MALASEMRRLSEQHATDYQSRRDAVLCLIHNAQDTVAQLEDAHRRLAHQIRDRIDELDVRRAEMAAEQQRKLTEFHDELHRNVASTIRGLEQAHGDRATEMRGRMDELGRARHTMGKHQQHRLAQEHAHLEAAVDHVRSANRADLEEAHEIWDEHARQMGGRRAGEQAAAPRPRPAAGRQDLTTIPGLGAGRLQKLHAIGIRTFAQLAAAHPESIRKALGPSGHLVNVEQWIREAKRRA